MCVCVCARTVFLSHKSSVTNCVAIYLLLCEVGMLDGNVKMSKNVCAHLRRIVFLYNKKLCA